MRALLVAGNHIAQDDQHAFCIAEIGNNHGGSVGAARLMMRAAADAGADAVKFQTRDNRLLYTRAAFDAPYHSEHAYGPTYGAHREALELPREAYADLKAEAESMGLFFFSTPFDLSSVDFLAKLDVPLFKIASGDLTNIPLIRYVASTGKPVIVSTGGATLLDVRRMADSIAWKPGQLAILQCTAAYPVQAHEMNLKVIETYRAAFPDVPIGLSDHFNGILSGPIAVMLGARIFEKHFTLNHTWKGTDHAFSLEPEGMRRFVRDLRRVPEMLGDGIKTPYESEGGGLRKMAKSLYAAHALEAGHVLTEADIALKSPGGGLPPYRVAAFIGRRLREPVDAEQMLAEANVE